MGRWFRACLLTGLGKHTISLLQGQTLHSEETSQQLEHWLSANCHCRPRTTKKKGKKKVKAVNHFCKLSENEHIALPRPAMNLFKSHKRKIPLKSLSLTHANSPSSCISLFCKKFWIPHCSPAWLDFNVFTLVHTAGLWLGPWLSTVTGPRRVTLTSCKAHLNTHRFVTKQTSPNPNFAEG